MQFPANLSQLNKQIEEKIMLMVNDMNNKFKTELEEKFEEGQNELKAKYEDEISKLKHELEVLFLHP